MTPGRIVVAPRYVALDTQILIVPHTIHSSLTLRNSQAHLSAICSFVLSRDKETTALMSSSDMEGQHTSMEVISLAPVKYRSFGFHSVFRVYIQVGVIWRLER